MYLFYSSLLLTCFASLWYDISSLLVLFTFKLGEHSIQTLSSDYGISLPVKSQMFSVFHTVQVTIVVITTPLPGMELFVTRKKPYI